MTAEDGKLLREFAREGSQDAFTALVRNHLNLVYSAALRRVRSSQLAEEVSQAVFLSLARNAASLDAETVLPSWLYQVTRNASVDIIRKEAARQAREQIAFQMSAQNDSSDASWLHIEAHLDEAMDSLEASDRTAILLRYFENKSLREVGEALGASEDAAQKRVTRALDRLRDHFGKRKIAIGAPALATLLSANAIQAAPAALALTIAAGSAATVATISTSIALTMTATQKAIVATIIAAAAITVGVQTQRQSNLNAQLVAAREQTAALSNEVQQLNAEREQNRKQIATLVQENAAKTAQPTESLKLRGEVSKLRQEKRELGATSGLSKITANPETKALMREQQKGGMGMIYKTFARDAKLTTEQTEKLNDILADHIMDNIDRVTTALQQKMTTEQADQVFSASDAELNGKLRELIGDEAFEKYSNYSRDILGNLSAHQSKSLLAGDDAEKQKKADQIAKILNEESQAVIAAANLRADYQLMPMLNFRNIASETEAEKSLKLLDSVYTRSIARLGGVLNKEETAKFEDLKTKAIANNRAALTMNRNLMAPIAE